jgi:transcriptional regulator with XRE-family HTH domain
MAEHPATGDLPLVLKLRLDRGVSVAEVERQTGVNHKTIDSYESGMQLRPMVGPLKALALYYDVSVSELYADFLRRRRELRNAA